MANTLLTVDVITREAVRLFSQSNTFVDRMPITLGSTLRIRLPNDYIVTAMQETLVSPQAAVALGVAAAVIKNPGVTRRFWDPSTWNNQQGSAGRDVPSSAGRPSSPDHQRTTGDR